MPLASVGCTWPPAWSSAARLRLLVAWARRLVRSDLSVRGGVASALGAEAALPGVPIATLTGDWNTGDMGLWVWSVAQVTRDCAALMLPRRVAWVRVFRRLVSVRDLRCPSVRLVSPGVVARLGWCCR